MPVAPISEGSDKAPAGLSPETQKMWHAAQLFRRRADALARVGPNQPSL